MYMMLIIALCMISTQCYYQYHYYFLFNPYYELLLLLSLSWVLHFSFWKLSLIKLSWILFWARLQFSLSWLTLVSLLHHGNILIKENDNDNNDVCNDLDHILIRIIMMMKGFGTPFFQWILGTQKRGSKNPRRVLSTNRRMYIEAPVCW